MGTLLEGLESGISTAIDKGKNLLGNPVTAAIGGAVVGSAVTGAVVVATRKRKKSARKARRKSSRKVSRRRNKRSRRTGAGYARTAGKGKDRSTRRIRMTKNGQPYIILKSGKARFIKKSSARSSRKRKGGRY